MYSPPPLTEYNTITLNLAHEPPNKAVVKFRLQTLSTKYSSVVGSKIIENYEDSVPFQVLDKEHKEIPEMYRCQC